MEEKKVNPIQDLFIDIEKIMNFIEIKDQYAFDECETDQDMRDDAEMWMGAMIEQDTYLTYKSFWNVAMFQEIDTNVKFIHIEKWMRDPYSIPLRYRDNLLKRGREAFFKQYQERNEYVRMLNGLPPINSTDFIYLSEPLRNQLHVDNDIPIHELPILIQNRLIATKGYQDLLKEYPDKGYLRYLGIYKIEPFIVRHSRDFELIRYLPMGRSDINPNLLKEFGSLYNEYREYVMRVLYNKNMEGLYKEYRTFMRFLIQCFVLLQITNKAIEGINNRNFLDDSILHIILSMHDIPRSLLMTKEVRRTLVINLLKLTRDKATDEVYYNLIKILGYQGIIISKLMLMRGQEFDDTTGQATFDDGSPMNNFEDIDRLTKIDDVTGEVIDRMNNNPYFIQIDIQDPNPYDTITNGKAPVYEYHSITDPDPTWWDLRDTQEVLKNYNYSIADSKYIMIEAEIHQLRYLFESIYFTRLVLDNKDYTDNFNLSIPELFGTEPVSVYDAMCYILAATCMNNGLSGEIISEEQNLLATAGFNFDIDLILFQGFLDTTKYVDKDRIMQFIENLSMLTPSDINRLFNEVMYPMREWLEEKISQTTNRYEFLEYETIYQALYTYDISKNSFLDDFETPIEAITKKYNLTEDEMIAFQHFYPRQLTLDENNIATSLKIDEYIGSKYYPFINHRDQVTWHINIEYKGIIYLHDILNSPDVRDIKNSEGEYIFIDLYDDGNGGTSFEIDHDTVREVIEAINNLNEDELRKAVFKIDTPIFGSNGEIFKAGDLLPASLRTGIFKNILIDKIIMDCDGLSRPPKTYIEYLYRKNRPLYDLLVKDNRFEYERETWIENVITVILALETELNMHIKYFEQSVVGSEMFFKPLITLIKHFKSKLVDFAKTGLRYLFADKIDAGGNSNMFKLFDQMKTTVHFIILSNRGINAQFGLYDTEHKANHKILILDRSHLLKQKTDGSFDVDNRHNWMGSIRMVDEVKFFKNGEPIDHDHTISSFYVGEEGTGRWEMNDNITMAGYRNPEKIKNMPTDTEIWKEFIDTNEAGD